MGEALRHSAPGPSFLLKKQTAEVQGPRGAPAEPSPHTLPNERSQISPTEIQDSQLKLNFR